MKIIHIVTSSLIVFFLLVLLFHWSNFLASHQYVQECFENKNINIVNMPFQNNVTCNNPCTTMSSCLLTGEQCQTDSDCKGCIQPQHNQKQYPTLDRTNHTIDSGVGEKTTKSKHVKYNESVSSVDENTFYPKFTNTPEYSLGTNEWKSPFDTSYMLYDKRFKPSSIQFHDMLNYPEKYTLSGEFKESGAMPYNY